MKGVSSETMFCTEGSSERWRRAQTTSQPTAKPAAIPPAAPTTNCRPASHIEKAPVTTAATATRYATMPVASLTRLSPSRIVTMRRGTPRRWATAVAAMASVGETIAPRTKAAAHGSPVAVWTTAPIRREPAVSGMAPRAAWRGWPAPPPQGVDRGVSQSGATLTSTVSGSDKTLCHELRNIGVVAELDQEQLYLFALHISAQLIKVVDSYRNDVLVRWVAARFRKAAHPVAAPLIYRGEVQYRGDVAFLEPALIFLCGHVFLQVDQYYHRRHRCSSLRNSRTGTIGSAPGE